MEQMVDTIAKVGVRCCQNVIHMEHILHPPTLRNMINYIHHVCGSESFEINTELSSFSFFLFFMVSWSEMFLRGQVLSSSLQWGIISNEVWSITRSHSPTRVGQNWLYLALKEKKKFCSYISRNSTCICGKVPPAWWFTIISGTK